MNIKPVPQIYAGVRFRSTLEADWAATLDALRIVWSYEPEAIQLPSGEYYRPDFWLPEIKTWFEVKGPHDERIGKTRELAQAVLGCNSECCRSGPTDGHCVCSDGHVCRAPDELMVVIGREPIRGMASWEFGDGTKDNCILQECWDCNSHYWLNEWLVWGCRAHAPVAGTDHRNPPMYSTPGSHPAWDLAGHLPFFKAPRAARGAA